MGIKLPIWLLAFLLAITCVLSTQINHVNHFRHISLKNFPMVLFFFQSNEFWPLNLLFENSEVRKDSNSQSGSLFGSVWVLSLTFSYTLGSMKCDSWASILARIFASLCFGCKPKAKVMISLAQFSIYHTFITFLLKKTHFVKWNLSN